MFFGAERMAGTPKEPEAAEVLETFIGTLSNALTMMIQSLSLGRIVAADPVIKTWYDELGPKSLRKLSGNLVKRPIHNHRLAGAKDDADLWVRIFCSVFQQLHLVGVDHCLAPTNRIFETHKLYHDFPGNVTSRANQ
jgi:hypothetical protein